MPLQPHRTLQRTNSCTFGVNDQKRLSIAVATDSVSVSPIAKVANAPLSQDLPGEVLRYFTPHTPSTTIIDKKNPFEMHF